MPAKCGMKTGDIDDLPRYIKAILNADKPAWAVQGYCRRHVDGGRDIAWRIKPGEYVTLGPSKYKGSELIAFAEATCELCPVQWHCARFAMQTEASVGTWGMSYELIEWLRANVEDPVAFIDAADSEDVPVQVAVRRARQLCAI